MRAGSWLARRGLLRRLFSVSFLIVPNTVLSFTHILRVAQNCCSFGRRNRVLAAEMRCADTGASARGNFRAVSSNFKIDRFCDLNILLLFDLSLAALCAADLTCAAAAAAVCT